jgi:hypothetical protein
LEQPESVKVKGSKVPVQCECGTNALSCSDTWSRSRTQTKDKMDDTKGWPFVQGHIGEGATVCLHTIDPICS